MAMDTWNTPFCETGEDAFNCDKKDKMVMLSNENSEMRVLNCCDISGEHDIGTNNASKRNCCSS